MESIKLSITLPMSAEELYNDWLDSKRHSAFTGGEAKCTKKVGGKFTAWDGYISGSNIELIPGELIKQNWRTSEFLASDKDSILEITFEEKGKKTKLNLYHHGLKKGDGAKYKDGWKMHYFEPMKEYYEE